MNLIEDDALFGHIAAEEERETLQSYFQETQAFKSVREGSKWLVLGRKGSGKTAMFYYLERYLKNSNAKVASLTLDDYPLSVLQELQSRPIDQVDAHVQTWKFALLITFMGLYLDAIKGQPINDPNLRVYNDFCQKNDIQVPVTAARSIADLIKRIDHFDITAFGVGAGISLSQSVNSHLRFGDHSHKVIAYVVNILRESMKGFLPKGKLIIQLDRLDEQWRNDNTSNALLIGLLKASRELNRELPGCRVIVFLRSDIYEVLHFQNRAHIDEYIQRIDWHEEDLERVIALRIWSKLPDNSASSSNDSTKTAWSNVFDTDSKYTAPKGAGQNIFRYFRVNSFLRPRDYIQLAKCLQQMAVKYEQKRISSKIMYKGQPIRLARLAEEEYSRRIFHELQDELMDTLPQFSDIMERLSQDVRYYVFTAAQLRDVISKSSPGINIDASIRILFECSVLGVDSRGGTRRDRGPGGRPGEYRYQRDGLSYDGTSHFKIHPSLRSHFNLRTRTQPTIPDTTARGIAENSSQHQITRPGMSRPTRKTPSVDTHTIPLWKSSDIGDQ